MMKPRQYIESKELKFIINAFKKILMLIMKTDKYYYSEKDLFMFL